MSDAEMDRLIEEIDIALWSLDLKFSKFPAAPTHGDKHVDEEGDTWTFLGEANGWAIIGKDRRSRGEQR